LNRNSDIGVFLNMELGHFGVVHAIQVVASEDEHVRGARGTDLEQLLAHRVSGALVPVRVLHGLFRRPDLYPTGVEGIKVISAGDMAVQRDRVELREHGDAVNTRVDAVADGNINEAVLARHWHRGF